MLEHTPKHKKAPPRISLTTQEKKIWLSQNHISRDEKSLLHTLLITYEKIYTKFDPSFGKAL